MLGFVPLVMVFVPITWLVLTRVTCRLPRDAAPVSRDIIRDELRRLGVMSPAERLMAAIFVITALLWIFRRTIRVGALTVPGWSDLLAKCWPDTIHPAFLSDATVAMGVATMLFIIPGNRVAAGRREPLMNWTTAERLPWGILLLFGGGFAIADAFVRTGLSAYIGHAFTVFEGAPPFVLVMGTCLIVTFLTELTSNTATTLIVLPIVAEAAAVFGVNPLLLMLPATTSASCAFMLPVATPPNAIVFASGRVRMGQMVRTGLVLNFVGVLVVSALMYLLVLPILGATATPPAWAG
jgi:sodium-dependent dicarboxylate transporter 2/3/5